MLLKSSVFLFILVSCLTSGNLASPYPRHSNGDGLLPEDVEGSIKQLTSEIEKSVNHLTRNSQWTYNNLVTIVRTGFEKGFQSVASWVLDFVLRTEFLTMADGSHVYFPLNNKADIEREYKTVALAVSKLLMNLKTMERTDQVLKNVTMHMITADTEPHMKELKASPEKMLKTFLHTYFQTLDHRMEADEELRHVYKQRKSEAGTAVRQNPKMLEPIRKYWDKSSDVSTVGLEEFATFLKDKTIYRQGLANKLFMKQSVKHFSMIFSQSDHQRYLLARAFIQIAHSSSSESKINEVYQRALVEAAGVPTDADDYMITDVLFNTIEKALESEPTLNTEVRTIMKQIEGSTIYDMDMFRIDFSPL